MDRCAPEARNTAARPCGPGCPSGHTHVAPPLRRTLVWRLGPQASQMQFSAWRCVWLVTLLAPLALGLSVAPPAHAADELTAAAEAVNAFRAQNGLPGLSLQPQLNQAAQGWSSYMAQTGTLSHTGPSGSFGDRIAATGYRACAGAENIAQGFGMTGSQAVQGWISSPPHRANLLNAQVRDMGLGSSQAANGAVYWTLDEALSCGGAAPLATATPAPRAQPTPTPSPRPLSSNVTSPLSGTSNPAGTVQSSTGFQFAVAQLATATATSTPAPAPAIAIGTSCTPSTANVGQNVTCVVTVRNAGTGAVTNVVVSDVLPGNTTFLSTTASQGTCTGTSTVACTLESLVGGGTATVTVVFVPTAAAAGTVLINTATVAGTGLATQSATATTTVVQTAALTITKTGAPNPVTVGQPLTYTLTITNPASTAATGVMVTDTLPGNVAFGSATWIAGTCSGTTTVTCSLGTIAAGASITITITVTPTSAAVGTTLTNTASVTGSGVPGQTVSATTVVSAGPLVILPNLPAGPPVIPPPNLSAQPLLPPPPPIVLPPPPPALVPVRPVATAIPHAAFAEIPVIPESDSSQLLLAGLAAIAGSAAYRGLRHR